MRTLSPVVSLLLAASLLFTLASGALDPSKTFASGSGLSTATAGSPASFTISPRDGNGLPFKDSSLVFDFTFLLAGSPISITPFANSNDDGNYTVDYSTQTAGQFSLEITVNSQPIKDSPFSLVVAPGVPSKDKSYAAEAGSQLFITAGERIRFAFIFKDSFSNSVTIAASRTNFTVETTTSLPTPLTIYSYFEAVGDQLYYEYQVNKTVNLALRIWLDLVPFWDHKVTVSPASISPINCISDTSELTNPSLAPYAGNDADPFIVFAKDRFGNALAPRYISTNPEQFTLTFTLLDGEGDPTTTVFTYGSKLNANDITDATAYSISFDPLTVAGTYSLSITQGGEEIADSPIEFTLLANDIASSSTYLVGDFSTPRLVGEAVNFLIVARDAYNNTRTYGGQSDEFVVEIFTDRNLISPSVVDLGNGTYSVSFTFNSSGSYVVDVYFFLDVVQGSGQLMQAMTVTSAENTVAYGDGLSSCKVGATCRFVVQARDRFGNNQTDSSDVVTLTLGGKALASEVTWVGDGVFGVAYKGHSGSRLGVFINGEDVQGSPFSVYVAPSDGAVGVIVAVVIIVAVALCLVGFIAYKRWQIRKLRKEWELKKALAYKEYQNQGPPVPLSNMMKGNEEPEWEDDEFARSEKPKPQADGVEDNEWSAMSQWIRK